MSNCTAEQRLLIEEVVPQTDKWRYDHMCPAAIKTCLEGRGYADKLRRERAYRLEQGLASKSEHAQVDGRHTDDYRIATETAERMYKIFRARRDIIEQVARWRKAIERTLDSDLKEIELALAALQSELDIAYHLDLYPIPASVIEPATDYQI